MKKRLSIIISILAAFTHLAQAQETEPGHKFSIELNPVAYAFSGWSIGGTYQPANLNKWLFNKGIYSFEMPDMFVEQIPGNDDEGWNLKISTAFTLGADYYPWRTDRSGFAFGLSTVLAQFEITNDNETEKANYTSLYFVPRASYTWYVFKSLYVMPWVGVEFHNKISGDTQVGALNFEPMTTQFSPNVSIGYTF